MLRAAREQRAQPPAPAQPVAQRPLAPRVYGDAGAPIAINFNLDSVFYDDAGYDLFAQDDVTPRFGVSIGYDLVAFADDLFLAPELGWGYESEDEHSVFGSVGTELTSHTFYAGASLRYVLLPWLQPQARLAAGVSVLDVEATATGEAADRDRAWSPFASLGAGVLLRTPTRTFENREGRFASLSLGLLIEGGYALRSGASFELDGASNKNAIPITPASLGELSLSGPYVRTSIVTRF
jgi:hypothetical protein